MGGGARGYKMELLFFSVAYVVFYIYSIVVAWRGIEFFNWLTDTDSPLQKNVCLGNG